MVHDAIRTMNVNAVYSSNLWYSKAMVAVVVFIIA